MSRLLPWIVLALVLAVLVMLARHTEGLTGALASGEMASLVYKIGLVVLVGGAVLAMFRQNFSQALTQAMIWVVIGLALVLGYTYRFELYDVGDRVMAELMPGRAVSHGHTVELARAGTGDFRVGTEVNGVRIAMVLDTGASSVVLTHDDAKAGRPADRVHQVRDQRRDRQRPHARGARHARPPRGRRHRRAPGAGADRPARPAEDQPARHELPQPPAELGSARRPAADAGQAVKRGE